MARFHGTLDGYAKNQKTTCGSKSSGLVTYCASHSGAVRCQAYVDAFGVDKIVVEISPWEGSGSHELLYDGPISGEIK